MARPTFSARVATGGELPLCSDRSYGWNASHARARVAEWASSDGSGDADTINWGQYATAFFWRDSSTDGKSFNDYKLPFGDVVDGELCAVWKAVASAASVMQGSGDGAHIPAEDEAAVREHIGHYYKKAAREYSDDSIVVPWSRAVRVPRLTELEPERSLEHGVEGFQRSFGAFGERERRSFALSGRPTVRDSGAGEGQFTVAGHAAVFNRKSLDLGGFQEIVDPGAFERVLTENPDVFLNWDHDMRYVFARTHNKTLDLGTDERGLAYWARVAPVTYADDLRVLLEGGYIDQASFCFTVADDLWEIKTVDGEEIVTRTILEIGQLFDVCITAQGAYPQTDSGVRSYIRSYAAKRGLAVASEPRVVVPATSPTTAVSLAKLQARARAARLGVSRA
jgi:HK97 family phage prohead protease